MNIDCHYHLEERLLTVEELIERMDRCKVDKVALMAVINELIPHTPNFLLKTLRFLLTHRHFRKLAQKLHAKFDDKGNIKIPNGIIEIFENPDNEAIFKVVKSYPDRFLAWAFVNPKGRDQVNEYEKWKDIPGFIGVKAHPFWHQFAPLELLPVAEKLEKTGKPLLIHLGFDAHGDYNALIEHTPKLKLILAHAGFPRYADIWKDIKENKNIYLDISASAYVDAKTTRQLVDYLGAERCLYGTDGPYTQMDADGKFDFGFIKNRLVELFPEKDIQQKILGENFLNLLNL
jgi:uncharacterized protein